MQFLALKFSNFSKNYKRILGFFLFYDKKSSNANQFGDVHANLPSRVAGALNIHKIREKPINFGTQILNLLFNFVQTPRKPVNFWDFLINFPEIIL